MKHFMESWVEDNRLSSDAKNLFRESIVCYKATAYRAAFLFGYLGLISEVRERILRAPLPSGFEEGEWANIQRKLLDDDEWEKIAVEQIAAKKNPFRLNDDIRQQFAYFRGRRNDCAHAKRNSVNDHHVEMLWSFVQSNLAKFAVLGGPARLLELIRQTLNPNRTPTISDYSQLVGQIPHAVPPTELPEFFSNLGNLIIESSAEVATHRQRVVPFLAQLMRSEDEEISRRAIELARANLALLWTPVVLGFPEVLGSANIPPTTIRVLWSSGLWQVRGGEKTFHWLLRSGRIPEREIPEAINAYLDKGWPSRSPSEEQWMILDRHGFFDKLEHKAFYGNKIFDREWADARANAITEYFRRRPIDGYVAFKLAGAFEAEEYPSYLQTPLRNLFREVEGRYNEFLSGLASFETDIPDRLNLEITDYDDDDIPF